MPHVHAGTLEALTIAAYMIIILAAAKTVAYQLSDRPIGQAVAYLFD